MGVAAASNAVIAKLKSTAAVTALVSNRIYPGDAGQGVEEPYIVVRRPQGDTRNQQINKRDSFRKTPLAIYCAGDRKVVNSAANVADAVIAALDPTTAVTSSQTWGTVSVDHCDVTDAYDVSENPVEADEIGFPCEVILVDLYHIC